MPLSLFRSNKIAPSHPRVQALRQESQDDIPEAFVKAGGGGLSPVSLRSKFFAGNASRISPVSPISPVSLEKFIPELRTEKPKPVRSSFAFLGAVPDHSLFQSPGLVAPV